MLGGSNASTKVLYVKLLSCSLFFTEFFSFWFEFVATSDYTLVRGGYQTEPL